MSNQEIAKILHNLENRAKELPLTGSEWFAIAAAKRKLLVNIWYTASEKPIIPEGHCGIEVLALLDTPSGTLQPYKMFYTESGWKYDSVKWWCYLPKSTEE